MKFLKSTKEKFRTLGWTGRPGGQSGCLCNWTSQRNISTADQKCSGGREVRQLSKRLHSDGLNNGQRWPALTSVDNRISIRPDLSLYYRKLLRSVSFILIGRHIFWDWTYLKSQCVVTIIQYDCVQIIFIYTIIKLENLFAFG